MRTLQQALVVAASGAVLLAQQNVMITRAGTTPAGVASTFNFVSGELIGGNPVKGAPYSADAVTETTQTLADGNRIVNQSTATVYRDSEGRQRREQALPSIGPFAALGEPHKTVFISDPVAGVNYSLESVPKIAIKLPAMKLPDLPHPGKDGAQIFVKHIEGPMPPPPPGVPAPAGPADVVVAGIAGPGPMTAGFGVAGPQMMFFKTSGDSPKVEQLGSKVIGGVSADGTRTTITIAAGQIGNDKPIQIVDEMWRSPELQVIVQSTHTDPRMGTTSYTLQNVSRAEPAATLFQVPADYTIKDPQALQQSIQIIKKTVPAQ